MISDANQWNLWNYADCKSFCQNDLQKQQECRDKVLTASGFLLNLVNDILDVNKMESGHCSWKKKLLRLYARVLSESSGIVEMQGRENGNFTELGSYQYHT